MSRRGRRALGLDLCLDRVKEIAELHAAGLGTTEIQSKLGGNRHAISRVRAILRAAEERGCANCRTGVGTVEGCEGPGEPFCKCSEEAS